MKPNRKVTAAFLLRRKYRSGFTLLELVVVIAIIAVLAALVLIGISSAREAARRTQCAANLRQLGLGLETYVSTWSTYPTYLPEISWCLAVLPNIEQIQLYDAYNYEQRARSDANLTVRETQPP